MTKKSANIENWLLVGTEEYGFLVGKITNHIDQKSFQTTLQQTSKVIRWDLANNIAETQNTIYHLGAKASMIGY